MARRRDARSGMASVLFMASVASVTPMTCMASPAAASPVPAAWRCAAEVGPERRPSLPCVDVSRRRIWLPEMAWHPKYTRLALADRPVATALAALLAATPAIGEVRIEVHDYRDPHAGERSMCRPCARAAVLAEAIVDAGIAPERVRHAGHHSTRLPYDRSPEAARAPGPKRYEVHIVRWLKSDGATGRDATGEGEKSTSVPHDQGEEGASTRP